MDRIIRDPAVRGGEPAVRGTRVTVGDILRELARGSTVTQLLRVFPLLNKDDVAAALQYAAVTLDEPSGITGVTQSLSIIVIVYAMPEQAKRTLYSLSTAHQRGVTADDYEVLVVENASPRLLGQEAALRYDMKARYFLRSETDRSPVGAANFGVDQALAPNVALMIDGARMVTPGIVEWSLRGLNLVEDAVVAVPGYHLGSELQQRAVDRGYDEKAEAGLLRDIEWPSNGYRLFDVSCLSGSCRRGLLQPFAESNFLCTSKRLFHKVHGYDAKFGTAGGGYCNLDLYKRLCDRPETTIVVLPGEGTFHQYHAGVTTGGTRGDARERLMEDNHDEYASIRGHRYKLPTKRGILLGPVPRNAARFMSENQPASIEHKNMSNPPSPVRAIKQAR